MEPDFTFKQGEISVFTDNLSYRSSDGAVSAADLTGATLSFVLRSLMDASPLALNGVAAIDNPTDPNGAAVSYTTAVEDTAELQGGLYSGSWLVRFANGQEMTFPTVGYLTVSVEERATKLGAQLVGLPDVKDYLNIRADDRTHDAKLIRYIHNVRPLVERVTGPILTQNFDEWHDGGQCFVQLRRCPATGYGTTPILTLTSCDEYCGSAKYPLTIVTEPSQGSTYSVMIDQLGRVVRRTAGGGVTAFPPSPQAVHVVYQAGQSSVPPNVYEGTLELIRVNYQTTQQVGRGRRTVADEPDPGPHLGFFMPGRVRELLAPNRRAPSIA